MYFGWRHSAASLDSFAQAKAFVSWACEWLAHRIQIYMYTLAVPAQTDKAVVHHFPKRAQIHRSSLLTYMFGS